MAVQVPHPDVPMYSINQNTRQIYFRNDTLFEYRIVMIPNSVGPEDFPMRSIIVDGNVEKPTCLSKIIPGQCVKINKVGN
jgi:hypothetical protein